MIARSAADGLLAAALAAIKAEHWGPAEALFRRILIDDPTHADSLNLSGVSRFRLQEPDRAIILIARAIRLAPTIARYHHNQANVERTRGHWRAAIAGYRASVSLEPMLITSQHLLASALQEGGDRAGAIVRYHIVLAIQPDLAAAYSNAGIALQDLGRPDDAVIAYTRATRLAPTFVAAHRNLALLLKEREDWAGAAAAFERLLTLDANDDEARAEAVWLRQMLCDWRAATEDEDKVLALVRAGEAAIPPFNLLSLASTPADQLHGGRRWMAARSRDVVPLPPPPVDPAKRRIRLGYLSADFREHATTALIAEMLSRHDRAQFEVIAYALGHGDGSPARRRIEQAVDRLVVLDPEAPAPAAGIIRADGIDILLDLMGHTKGAVPAILAARPAAIQVNLLGYPGTSGAAFIDYIIADAIVLPFNEQPHVSERIVHLPGCYQPNDSRRVVAPTTPRRADCGLPETGFVFCCFNNSFKIVPQMFDRWMRLLKAVPDSVLWLLDNHPVATANLRRAAKDRGVSADRLIFAARLPMPEHLARQRVADLFLDTLPCNAHTTASDALWVGLPVLTCQGTTFAGRVAASLLYAADLAELVADTLPRYEAIALELATDPDKLRRLRRDLMARRVLLPLFDGTAYAGTIESAYRTMWHRWQNGQAPAPFAVDGAAIAPSVLFARAVACQQDGDGDRAAALLRRLLCLHPDHHDTLQGLGVFAYQRKNHRAAALLIARAITVSPAHAGYHCNFGCALMAEGRYEAAEAAFREAQILDPGLPRLAFNLGNALYHQGNLAAAVACYRRGIAAEPENWEAYDNLGVALRQQQQSKRAETAHRRALALVPTEPLAHYNLALALLVQAKVAAAIEHAGQAVALTPDADASALQLLISARRIGCDWNGVASAEAALLALVREDCGGIEPFGLLLLDSTAADQVRCARRWTRDHTIGVPRQPERAHRHQRGRIRLGYLSTDFCDHAVAHLIVEMIEKHDRSRFEVTAYALAEDDGTPIRRRLEQAFDRFVDLTCVPSTMAAGRIGADEIDILIDLNGHTGESRLPILAARPAPVQVAFLGYPGTMGADFIDYIIADPVVAPLNEEAFFSEHIVHLPTCYQPNDSQRRIATQMPSRRACGLPDHGFVFCSFNNSHKMTPTVFDVWMNLLREVPDSVLWLLDSNPTASANLRREAAARGVDADRLVFAPRMELPQHLARHRHADLFLDTLPYNAHTTASDALWVGVPVLTVHGSTFAGRVAASLLQALGLPELICGSLDAYARLALDLARDPSRLRPLREHLSRAHRGSPLFRGEPFARNIEAAFEMMWQRWQDGRPAGPLIVPTA